jgi:hypothetical protein
MAETDIAVLSLHVRCWGVNGLAGPRVDEPASDGCRDQSDDGKVANASARCMLFARLSGP